MRPSLPHALPHALPRALVAVVVASCLTLTACGADTITSQPARPGPPAVSPTPVPTSTSSTSSSPQVRPARPSAPTSTPRTPEPAPKRLPLTRKVDRKVARKVAGTADDNPLANRTWGTYEGDQDLAWEPYVHANGATRSDLAAIALTPKAKWFGYWIRNADIAAKVHDYVANATGGDPDTLVQMTLFRMVPWELETCKRRGTPAEAAAYRDWIDRFAAALGDTHAAIVLQPDAPFALCAPGGPAAPAALIRYSAQKLSALPNTSVYLEAGAADWPADGQGGVDAVLRFLVPEGVQYVRGISMDTTHYASVADDVRRASAIVEALAARGITGKHVVLNTAMNGVPHPFLAGRPANPNYLPVCRSTSDPTTCVALGIPPTTDVANPRWGLPADVATLARAHVDAYLWVGRPWLYKGATPFLQDRALSLVRTARYRDLLPR